MSTPYDLSGRIALVTGATKGLGKQIAAGLAECGAHVVVVSRKQEACDETAAELTERFGVAATPIACHVGDWDAIDALVDDVYQRLGRVDVLFNNAGIAPLYDKLENVSQELFDKVFAVNLRGPYRLTTLVGARMAAGDGGSIVNVSAVGSLKPAVDALPYSASKAALDALTAGFAKAYGPRVRVNSLMPGAFMTELAEHWTQDVVDRNAAESTLERVGQPSEIVGAALYLASDASSFTTGTVLRVDGGMALGQTRTLS